MKIFRTLQPFADIFFIFSQLWMDKCQPRSKEKMNKHLSYNFLSFMFYLFEILDYFTLLYMANVFFSEQVLSSSMFASSLRRFLRLVVLAIIFDT